MSLVSQLLFAASGLFILGLLFGLGHFTGGILTNAKTINTGCVCKTGTHHSTLDGGTLALGNVAGEAVNISEDQVLNGVHLQCKNYKQTPYMEG